MPRYYPIVTVEGQDRVYQFDPSSPPSPQQISEWAKAVGGTYTGRLARPDDPRVASSIPDPSIAPEAMNPEAVPRLKTTGPVQPGSMRTQEEIASGAEAATPTFLSMIPSIVAGSAAPAALGPLINAIPDPRIRAAIIAAGPLVHNLARGVLAAGGGAAGAIPGHYIQQSQRSGTLSQHPYYGIPETQTGPSMGTRVGSEAFLSAFPEIASSVPLGILQGIRSTRLSKARMPEVRHLTDVQAGIGLSPPSARGILKSGTLRRIETSRTVQQLGAQHLDTILSEAHHQLDQLGGKVAASRDVRLLDPEVFAKESKRIIRTEITPGPVESRLMLGKLQAAAKASGGIAPTMANARTAVARKLIAELEESSGFPLSTLLSGNELLAKATSANRLGELVNLGKALPELGELVRRAHLAELISRSSNAVRSGQPVFQPTLFLKAVDNTPDDILRAVYGKKGYHELRNFTDALASTPEATEVARTRLSPTGSFAATRHGWPIVATAIGILSTAGGAAAGFTPQTIGPMGASLFYTTTAAMVATPAVINRLLRSEDGVRWLTGAVKTANKWTGSPDQLNRTLLRTGIQAGIHNILTSAEPITTASAAELDDQFSAPEFSNPPVPQFSRAPVPQFTNPPVPQLSSAPTNLPSPVATQSRVPVEVTPEERISRFIREKNPLSLPQRR